MVDTIEALLFGQEELPQNPADPTLSSPSSKSMQHPSSPHSYPTLSKYVSPLLFLYKQWVQFRISFPTDPAISFCFPATLPSTTFLSYSLFSSTILISPPSSPSHPCFPPHSQTERVRTKEPNPARTAERKAANNPETLRTTATQFLVERRVFSFYFILFTFFSILKKWNWKT